MTRQISAVWNTLPKYKSLFRAPPHLGLPIGDLTSRFFADVYMNQLDQYIAHRLKGRYAMYWQRYANDIRFLGADQAPLRSITSLVQGFLQRELHLTLNPSIRRRRSYSPWRMDSTTF